MHCFSFALLSSFIFPALFFLELGLSAEPVSPAHSSSLASQTPPASAVVQKKNIKLPSSAKLKEQLGEASRDMLFSTSATLRRMSNFQLLAAEHIELVQKKKLPVPGCKAQLLHRSTGKSIALLAQVYDRFSLLIEQLFNNEKNIKKAARQELFDAITCIKNTEQQLMLCFASPTKETVTDAYVQGESEKLQKTIALLDDLALLPKKS